MNPNLRDALKYMKEAQAARDAGDYAKARELCDKSIALFSTPEASKLLESINILNPQPKTSPLQLNNVAQSKLSSSNRTQVNEPHDAMPIREKPYNRFDAAIPAPHVGPASDAEQESEGGMKKAILLEQREAVRRVIRYNETSYYEILCVPEDSTAIEIEISYRKLARQLNPEHNKAPGASDALSLVSTAYQVLSDKGKRATYDKGDQASGGVPLGGGLFAANAFQEQIIANALQEQKLADATQVQMIAKYVEEQKLFEEQMIAQAVEDQKRAKAVEDQMVAKYVEEQKLLQEQMIAKAVEDQKRAKAVEDQMIAKYVEEQKRLQEQMIARAVEEQKLASAAEEQMIAKYVEEQKRLQEQMFAMAVEEQKRANAMQEQMVAKAVQEYTEAMAAQSTYSGNLNPYLQQLGADDDESASSLSTLLGLLRPNAWD